MYKVLLVDDEQFDLAGMQRLIPWNELQTEVVLATNNSFQAYEYMLTHDVDIVVSDIKMPIMSGLEMARKILEYKPNLKIIFISGFSDFQYAKQAIGLNASGYVLKPVDDNELIALVRRTVNELNGIKDIQKSVDVGRLAYIRQLLDGSLTEEESYRAFEVIGLSALADHWITAVIEIESVEENVHAMEQVISLLSNKDLKHACGTAQNKIGILCNLEVESLEQRLESVMLQAQQEYGLKLSAGIGKAVASWKNMWESYLLANEHLDNKLFMGSNKIIGGVRTDPVFLESTKNMNELLKTLFTAVTQYELVQIDDCITNLFSFIGQWDQKIKAYNFTLHFISKLEVHLSTINEDFKSLLGWGVQDLDQLYRFETIDDMQSWIRKQMFFLSELIYSKRSKKNQKLIEEIETYIEEHISESLILKEVAHVFSYSPGHLGFLFKEETGENYSDFVIRKRLEKACSLLSEHKLKIYEVADAVGYKNLTYFSRQFRERFGVTPGEYRKQI